MADQPFDTTPIGYLERPRSDDHNQNTSQIYRTLRDLLRMLFAARSSASSSASQPVDGFVGDGLRVVPSSPAAMSVQVTPGFGFVNAAADVPTEIGASDIVGLDDLSAYKPVFLLSPVTFPITAPTGTNSRIDIIEIKPDRRLENLIARRQFDAALEEFVPHSYYKTLAWGLDGRTGIVAEPASSTAGLSYKTGTEALAPIAPPTTPGYIKIAEIRTGSGTTTVTGSLISDMRKLLSPGGIVTASAIFRVQWNGGTPIITASNIVAPPGVELGAKPLSTPTRGSIEVFCIGGEFTSATVQVFPMTDNTVVGDTIVVPRIRRDAAALVQTLTSAEQAELAAATPPLLTGYAAKRARAFVETVFFDGALSTVSPSLEDISISVRFELGYQ